ncbi:hypothetical protein ME763_11975 [Streptomyces murinus]|nr:hypothetical protein [Streptomyces murinus]WDO06334.1 hypothetical protein ME763_11975 [Streptomyces murinus]
MTSFWTGERVRLRGIEPDDRTAFMRLAADEERLGSLLQPPRSAKGHRAWAKEQAVLRAEDDRVTTSARPASSPTTGPRSRYSAGSASSRKGAFVIMCSTAGGTTASC